MNKKERMALLPKYRFPEFLNYPAWEKTTLNKLLFETKQRNRELKYSKDEVLSVSGEYGCVNQIELLGRSYAGESVKEYHIVETGDVVYTKSPLKRNPFGIIKENKGPVGIVSTLYAVYRTTSEGSASYLDQYFCGEYNLNSYLQPIVRKGAKNDMKVNNSAVLSGEIIVPKLKEQQKIADCLSSIDDLIAAENEKLETLKAHKKGLMQKLFPAEGKTLPEWRFPEFRNSGEWEKETVNNLISTITPPKKLLSSTYKKYGKFPIIDQSQEYICGWTDDKNALIISKFTLLIFGDHTCVLKIINKPFAQGADGIKILLVDENIEAIFLYQFLLFDPVKSDSYRRHFSDLKEKKVLFPKKGTGEQKKIADCLSALDVLITAQAEKIEAFKLHKKGLMKGLFPSIEEVSQ